MIIDNLFNFRLEKWWINLSDTERNASSNQIWEKFISVNLISELDKGFKLVLELWLQRFVPILVGDVLCDTLAWEEHWDLGELLQIECLNMSVNVQVQGVADVAHVCYMWFIKFLAETTTQGHAQIESIFASRLVHLGVYLLENHSCKTRWDRPVVHNECERDAY